MKLDAKSIAAWAALVAALSGAVELRVQVGLMASKVEQVERKVERIERLVDQDARTAANGD